MLYETIFRDEEGILEEFAINAAIRYVNLIRRKLYDDPIHLKGFIQNLESIPKKIYVGVHGELLQWCKSVLDLDHSCEVGSEELRHKFELICSISTTTDPIRVMEDIVFCLIKKTLIYHQKVHEIEHTLAEPIFISRED